MCATYYLIVLIALLGLTYLFLFFVHRLAEFIVDRLKKMEKISEDDIADIKKEFGKRDVNKSNTLTESDLPQSTQAEN